MTSVVYKFLDVVEQQACKTNETRVEYMFLEYSEEVNK